MLHYIVQRFLNLTILLLLMSIFVFIAMHSIPGNPVDVFYGTAEGISKETKTMLAHELGLDQPLPSQYLVWLGRFVQGDWGVSYSKRQAVFSLVVERLPSTFLLAISSLVFAIVLSIPLGILSASRHQSYLDNIILGVAFLGQSIPGFWLGILLILIFSLGLRWLPTFGFVSPAENVYEALRHLVLPSVTLGLGMSILLLRMVRSSLIEELGKEYILVAWAKGLSPHVVFSRHALKNALIPALTMSGILFGFAMSGSVVVETVFTWPGIGRLLLDSILNRDYPVVQSIVLINATVFVLVSLLIDISYSLIDPRIRSTNKAY